LLTYSESAVIVLPFRNGAGGDDRFWHIPDIRPGGAFAVELEVLGFVTKSGKQFQPGVIQHMLAVSWPEGRARNCGRLSEARWGCARSTTSAKRISAGRISLGLTYAGRISVRRTSAWQSQRGKTRRSEPHRDEALRSDSNRGRNSMNFWCGRRSNFA
jgi:hypothetical protein